MSEVFGPNKRVKLFSRERTVPFEIIREAMEAEAKDIELQREVYENAALDPLAPMNERIEYHEEGAVLRGRSDELQRIASRLIELYAVTE